MNLFISPCVHYGYAIFAQRIKPHLLLEKHELCRDSPDTSSGYFSQSPHAEDCQAYCSMFFCHRLIRNPYPMVFDLICLPITSHKKDFLMNTKEWGVLSFLVGISMAGLFQEVPSSMFVLVVVPVFCTIIGYSAWRNSINLTQTINANPQSAGKHNAVRSFQRSF